MIIDKSKKQVEDRKAVTSIEKRDVSVNMPVQNRWFRIKTAVVAALFIGVGNAGFAQEAEVRDNERVVVYSVFANVVPDNFRAPLIGFVNVCTGSHGSPQIGFFNWNKSRFSSLQMGFVNTAGGSLDGVQLGFVNTTEGSLDGVQLGFVNTASQSFNGLQMGFINTVAGENTKGLQIGFVNTSANKTKGAQIGFVNTSVNEADGAQISFVNITKRLKGLQLGFVNCADTVENGLPLGFLSVVRRGGYRAVEVSVSEVAPVNVAFKIGVRKLYTFFILSYCPWAENRVGGGMGLGSIIPVNGSLFFNPELNSISAIEKNPQQFASFVPRFGYKINSRISVTAAPSLTFTHTDKSRSLQNPFFRIAGFGVNPHSRFILGAQAGISIEL